MATFSPVTALLGGMMIGLAAAIMLIFNGKIAGISGILGGVLNPQKGEWGWRAVFLVALILGGLLVPLLQGRDFTITMEAPWWGLIIAGYLVGFGTRLGNGCTSGHGVCGLARFSPRSLAATLTFMGVAALTVTIVRHALGGL